jgi:predicted Zn-dependent protease
MRRWILAVAIGSASLRAPRANAQTPARRTSASPAREVAAQAPRFTPEQLRAAGAELVSATIARHGRAENPAWQRDVDQILRRLERAADLRERVEFVIVKDPTFNASAVPGRYMIVNAGMLTDLATFAASAFPTDSSRARAEYEGYLASILGHELAHHTLGHTSRADLRGTRRPGDPPDAELREIERMMSDPRMLREQRRTRDQESDADRMGSIYALRAGWTIQHAISLFRIVDSVMKREGETRALDYVTWLREHPRASERAANLEHLRGTLTLDQTRFDDAITLVRNGVMLDTAVILLDTVLAHFPHQQQARHARATALHKQFIRKMSASALVVRSAVGTYDADIIGTVREGALPPATQATLDRARRAYRAVLAESLLPYSLANLAVLDAYAGDMRTAVARADSAVRLDTTDAVIRLTRGVVGYLANRPREALADFRAAERLAGEVSPVTRFDIGRALLATGDSAAGRATLREYASMDDSGPWHDLALSLAGRASTAQTPTPAGRPAGAGAVNLPVAFGSSPSVVRQTLGKPDETGVYRGAVVWRYPTRGVVVVLGANGVVMIGLATPSAGSIDGVKVGDPVQKAVAAWGTPTEREEQTMYFQRGPLVVVLDSVDGRIQTITVVRDD